LTCCATKPDGDKLTRTAMCAACIGHKRECKVSHRFVGLHIDGEPCPLNRHPTATGIVRWMGVDWIGVPFPIRAYLYLRRGDGCSIEWCNRFEGCGCIDVIKAAWSRLATFLVT